MNNTGDLVHLILSFSVLTVSVASESASHSTLVTAESIPELHTEGLDVGSADTPTPRMTVPHTGMVFSKYKQSQLVHKSKRQRG